MIIVNPFVLFAFHSYFQMSRKLRPKHWNVRAGGGGERVTALLNLLALHRAIEKSTVCDSFWSEKGYMVYKHFGQK